jgi:hypothetical protein
LEATESKNETNFSKIKGFDSENRSKPGNKSNKIDGRKAQTMFLNISELNSNLSAIHSLNSRANASKHKIAGFAIFDSESSAKSCKIQVLKS